ncbi:hypothetical protein [Pedobacter hartonius]|uniref:Uncharacterized protein n=1 Tax=Pedobacter hartonius TaxID=425514 RepID=A0A1H4H6G6_9SPHI|nr:hypothetical protein [Pedobacter hartonius]SEB16662.1 hypothetical protein SAMN05443550_11379 [Pedobacter hartonius]
MRIQGVVGAIVMAAGGMCPLVHVTFMGNWNYFQIDPVLGTVFYFIVVLGLAASYFNKSGLMRFSGWAGLIWIILTLCAVWLKSHDFFSFIHFKKLINLAAGMVKYRWGWLVILAGVLALMTVRKPVPVLQPGSEV